MNLERIVLTLSGLAIVAAFFLPYMHIRLEVAEGVSIGEVTVSGLSIVQTGLDAAGVLPDASAKTLVDFLGKAWNGTENMQEIGLVTGLMFVMAGPFIFLLYSLGYLFRGLAGRQYKRGIFFTIAYTGIAWLVCWLLGRELEMSLNFFRMAGLGFWLAFGGMFAAAFSLFFAKNLE